MGAQLKLIQEGKDNMDRQKALEAALAQIDRAFGKGSAMKLGSREAMQVEAVSTGSLGLDIALGIGGLPRGRIIEIYGPESSGKTTLALHAIAEAQKTGGTAAFVDAEHALDPVYAKKLGVNIDELIVCKKNFSGGVTENIIWLYLQLNLKKDSLRKLRTTAPWHIRAKGIQELYLMEQQDVLKMIYKNTNSNNEFVRMEAQTGVINLTGFPGLRFLDVVSYPITEWQQLKLLEQLRLHPVKQDLSDKIPNWLHSSNTTVIVFALKLADEYQVFSVKDQVMACMEHADKTVRSQALKTLVRLADETTAALLAGYFPNESPVNQLYILDALRTLATENETAFLVSLLDHGNDTVKLKAAVVLAEVSETGMELILQKSRQQPEPFERIWRHIKKSK